MLLVYLKQQLTKYKNLRLFLFFLYSLVFIKARKILPKENEIPKSVGNLLYALSTRSKQQIHNLHRYLIKYVCEEKIKNEPQLLGRIKNENLF